MKRLDDRVSHEWHVAINQHHDGKMGTGEWKNWMYEAKSLADEVPRLTMLFERERLGNLPDTFKACSFSESEPVPDNHLQCCLGVVCRDCDALKALDTAKLTPEQIDAAKAWTCAAHILSTEGFIDTSEGYILTADDRMYWDRVYQSLSAGDEDSSGNGAPEGDSE